MPIKATIVKITRKKGIVRLYRLINKLKKKIFMYFSPPACGLNIPSSKDEISVEKRPGEGLREENGRDPKC